MPPGAIYQWIMQNQSEEKIFKVEN